MAGRPQRRAREARERLYRDIHGIPHPDAPLHSAEGHALSAVPDPQTPAQLADVAFPLEREQGYKDALALLMPLHVDIDMRIGKLLSRILKDIEAGDIDKSKVDLFKTLMGERSKQLDRFYGKATARQQIDMHKTTVAVDVAELVRSASAQSLPPADDGTVIDVEGYEAADIPDGD